MNNCECELWLWKGMISFIDTEIKEIDKQFTTMIKFKKKI